MVHQKFTTMLTIGSDFQGDLHSRKRKLAAGIAALQLLACATCAAAQDLPAHIKFLTGLKALYVLVDNSSKEAAQIKLTSEEIQRAVESKLRVGGIKILTADENLRAPHGPFMSVSVGMRTRDSILFGDITISVYQWGCLEKKPGDCGGVITWQTSGVFTKKAREAAAQWLLGHISNTMNIFLNDYFSANPGQDPSPSLPASPQPKKSSRR